MNDVLVLSKIPEHFLEDVRNRGYTNEDIQEMDALVFFYEYCQWQGLLGWGDTLFNLVELLKKAER